MQVAGVGIAGQPEHYLQTQQVSRHRISQSCAPGITKLNQPATSQCPQPTNWQCLPCISCMSWRGQRPGSLHPGPVHALLACNHSANLDILVCACGARGNVGIVNSKHHYWRYRILSPNSQQVWVTAKLHAARTCGNCQGLGSLAAVVSGEVEAVCVQLDLGGWVDLIARQISFDSNGRSDDLVACRRIRQAAQEQCQTLLELPAHQFHPPAHKIRPAEGPTHARKDAAT